jgi:hypothetical protein
MSAGGCCCCCGGGGGGGDSFAQTGTLWPSGNRKGGFFGCTFFFPDTTGAGISVTTCHFFHLTCDFQSSTNIAAVAIPFNPDSVPLRIFLIYMTQFFIVFKIPEAPPECVRFGGHFNFRP